MTLATLVPGCRTQPDAEEPSRFIDVKTLTGATHRVLCEEFETVGSLKSKIKAITGHEITQQRLIYAGKQFEDPGALISSYNLEPGTGVDPCPTVHLVARLKGC